MRERARMTRPWLVLIGMESVWQTGDSIVDFGRNWRESLEPTDGQ
jgi:hypothetical protein